MTSEKHISSISEISVFTWLNAMDFISLVTKIDAATIQIILAITHCSQTMFMPLFLQSVVGSLTCGDYWRNII